MLRRSRRRDQKFSQGILRVTRRRVDWISADGVVVVIAASELIHLFGQLVERKEVSGGRRRSTRRTL